MLCQVSTIHAYKTKNLLSKINHAFLCQIQCSYIISYYCQYSFSSPQPEHVLRLRHLSHFGPFSWMSGEIGIEVRESVRIEHNLEQPCQLRGGGAPVCRAARWRWAPPPRRCRGRAAAQHCIRNGCITCCQQLHQNVAQRCQSPGQQSVSPLLTLLCCEKIQGPVRLLPQQGYTVRMGDWYGRGIRAIELMLHGKMTWATNGFFSLFPCITVRNQDPM